MGPKVGRHMVKHSTHSHSPTFNWDTEDKYNELKEPQTRGK